MNTIGEKIKTLRKNKNLSQEDFAEKIGVTQSTITKWENGVQSPRSKNIEKLIKNLDTTISELFTDSDITQQEEQEKKHYSMSFWGQVIDNAKEVIEHGDPEEILYAKSSLEIAYKIMSKKQETITSIKNKASIKAGANSKNTINQR